MKTLYKLTTEDWLTRKGYHNETKWGLNVTHKAKEKTGGLCSGQYIHAYTSPELAVLLNPVHANIDPFVLWECKGQFIVSDKGLKVGCKSLTTLHIIKPPVYSINQRVIFSILCASRVYKDQAFLDWADKFINNVDRTKSAAWSAAESAADSAADSASCSAARSAARSAAEAAAESAADSAAWSAAWSAWSAARSAAWSAWSAADSAAWSARSADEAANTINLDFLAKEALTYN
jgi:hypothetical protein